MPELIRQRNKIIYNGLVKKAYRRIIQTNEIDDLIQKKFHLKELTLDFAESSWDSFFEIYPVKSVQQLYLSEVVRALESYFWDNLSHNQVFKHLIY